MPKPSPAKVPKEAGCTRSTCFCTPSEPCFGPALSQTLLYWRGLRHFLKGPPEQQAYRCVLNCYPTNSAFLRYCHSLRVVFPLRGPGNFRGGNADPQNWCKLPKNCKIVFSECFFHFPVGIFPRFRWSERGGEFCNFSLFSGVSAPEASRAL